MDEHDGYDLSFERMMLASDARLGRELYQLREKQGAAVAQAAKENAKMIEEGTITDGVVEKEDIPFRAILHAVAGSTCCEAPNLTLASDWKEASEWCKRTITEHVKKMQRVSQQNPPARSQLSREQTVQVMDHIESLQTLLKGT